MRLQSAFAATRAAVINFSRAIALELAPFEIRVNAIAPGSVLTQETSALFSNPKRQRLAEDLLSHIPLGRPGTPEEIASAALFLAFSRFSVHYRWCLDRGRESDGRLCQGVMTGFHLYVLSPQSRMLGII